MVYIVMAYIVMAGRWPGGLPAEARRPVGAVGGLLLGVRLRREPRRPRHGLLPHLGGRARVLFLATFRGMPTVNAEG